MRTTNFKKTALVIALIFSSFLALSQEKVEQWKRFEITLKNKVSGNAFKNANLSAKFYNADTAFVVNGFYDGNDIFKIRFMPQQIGEWKYKISSNIKSFNNKSGNFICVNPSNNNHGIVKVSNTHHFKYADGEQYFPFGTTNYAWALMGQKVRTETLQNLKKSGFNKVRMCVLPKDFGTQKKEPELYPYEIKKVTKDKKGNKVFTWNFDKFNPAFFQHLENRIEDLDKLGIQADLILFHPYDGGRWGFNSMSNSLDKRYLEYLIARVSSYKNVWWSLANEWDYIDSKSVNDWESLIETVVQADPYAHLRSIHGSTAKYYNYSKPELTHVSIQDETPVYNSYSSSTLRRIYKKPILLDEVGYEGNLDRRWGRLSPEKMMHFVWNGVISGTYVTHGEVYKVDEKPLYYWSNGGSLKGKSWKRIKFLKEILEKENTPLFMADIGRDLKTASTGKGTHIIYFGEEIKESWLFNLPKKNGEFPKLKEGTKFKVEIIDAWDMTITSYSEIFEVKKVHDNYRLYDKDSKEVRLPYKPYIALKISQIQ